MRITRPLTAAIALLAAPLLIAGCGGGDAFDEGAPTTPAPAASAQDLGELTVGGADFTEMVVMENMYKLLLEEQGFTVDITSVSAREVYLPALEKGEVDVAPEYAATLAEYLNREANGPDAEPIASNDPQATVEAMQPLAEAKGLVLLDPAQAQDSNGYYVAKSFADENNLSTLSDLGALGQPVTLAAGDECMERPFCAPGLTATYGIEITGVTGDGFGSLTGKQKVLGGQAQLGTTGTTDGTLSGLGLVLLEDDRKLQAADNLIPLVNAETAGEPKVAEALNELAPVLTTDDLADLNAKVDEQRQKPEDVARGYLMEKGLL